MFGSFGHAGKDFVWYAGECVFSRVSSHEFYLFLFFQVHVFIIHILKGFPHSISSYEVLLGIDFFHRQPNTIQNKAYGVYLRVMSVPFGFVL